MKIADLRSRVDVLRKTTTEDEIGGRVPGWTGVFSLAANIKALSSAEVYKLAQIRIVATHKITVRAGHTILPADKFVYGEREFKIVGQPQVDEFNKTRFVAFTVAEGVHP